MESKIYNQQGKETGTITLPKEIFNVAWNADLVHEITKGMAQNNRHQTAHTKSRAEVRGGGKKPWRQKGTGRARHGSIRSPLWVGGGVTHGPRNEKVYTVKLNKKKKAKALYTVLSRKLKDKEILFLDTLTLDAPKTAQAKKILQHMTKISGFESVLNKKNNSAVFSFDKRNENVEKSLRNFNNIKTTEIKNINPLLLLQYKYLVIVNPEVSLTQIANKL